MPSAHLPRRARVQSLVSKPELSPVQEGMVTPQEMYVRLQLERVHHLPGGDMFWDITLLLGDSLSPSKTLHFNFSRPDTHGVGSQSYSAPDTIIYSRSEILEGEVKIDCHTHTQYIQICFGDEEEAAEGEPSLAKITHVPSGFPVTFPTVDFSGHSWWIPASVTQGTIASLVE